MVPNGITGNWLGGLSFRGSRICEASDLPGYNKKAGHRVPVEFGTHAETLFKEWGAVRIESLATQLHAKLRQALGLKRADIQVDISPGAIRMRCPVAEIRCWIEQDKSNPSRALEQVEVDHLKHSSLLENEAFLQIFHGTCNGLRWQGASAIDVESLIDQLESHPEHAAHLEYPLDASWMRFTPPPGGIELYCDSEGVSFIRCDKEIGFPSFVGKAISLFPLISGLQPT
jgi:hypothetical protein